MIKRRFSKINRRFSEMKRRFVNIETAFGFLVDFFRKFASHL